MSVELRPEFNMVISTSGANGAKYQRVWSIYMETRRTDLGKTAYQKSHNFRHRVDIILLSNVTAPILRNDAG